MVFNDCVKVDKDEFDDDLNLMDEVDNYGDKINCEDGVREYYDLKIYECWMFMLKFIFN